MLCRVVGVEGMLVIGPNASNIFAEGPVPKVSLYICIDKQYRKWWATQGKSPIPPGYVLPVNHTLHSHPESLQLWVKTISKESGKGEA